MMNGGIVTTEKNTLAKIEALKGNWEFAGDAADILIPKILTAQFTSKFVQSEEVQAGQLVKSTSLDVIGGKDKPVQIIPLHHTKNWVVSKKVQGKYEFQRFEPFSQAHRDLSWEYDEGGASWKREMSLNFFVLIPSDIDADLIARKAIKETGSIPDVEASLLPCMLAFKSTSYKAGKSLVTHFAKAAEFGLPPFVNYFNLTTEKVTNDRGTFFVLNVDRGGKTNDDHLGPCAKWHNIVARQSMKVDDSQDAVNVETQADAQTEF